MRSEEKDFCSGSIFKNVIFECNVALNQEIKASPFIEGRPVDDEADEVC